MLAAFCLLPVWDGSVPGKQDTEATSLSGDRRKHGLSVHEDELTTHASSYYYSKIQKQHANVVPTHLWSYSELDVHRDHSDGRESLSPPNAGVGRPPV